MKTRIVNKEEEKKFQPFDVVLTVETEQEARLLYHVFNRNYLKEIIFTGRYDHPYNQDIKPYFDGGEYELISKELGRQGIEL